MKKTRRYCPKCGKELHRETHKGLREEYPFVCYYCDENFYRIEVLTKKRRISPIQAMLMGHKLKKEWQQKENQPMPDENVN